MGEATISWQLRTGGRSGHGGAPPDDQDGGGPEPGRTVIVADDVFVRRAATLLLREAGMPAIGTRGDVVDVGLEGAATIVVVADRPRAADRYEVVRAIPGWRAAAPDAALLAIVRSPCDPLVELRFAEAGTQYLVAYDDVCTSAVALPRVVVDPPASCRVPSTEAIRRQAGLAPDGDLTAFVAQLDRVDPSVWQRDVVDLDRHDILRLRRLALDVAGLPPRSAAASLPEWPVVQRFVRRLLGREPSWSAPATGDVRRQPA